MKLDIPEVHVQKVTLCSQELAIEALLSFIERHGSGISDTREILTFIFTNENGATFRKIFLNHNVRDLKNKNLQNEVASILANASRLLGSNRINLEIDCGNIKPVEENIGFNRNKSNLTERQEIKELEAEPNPEYLRPILLASFEASLATLDQNNQLVLRLCQLKALQDFRDFLKNDKLPLRGYFVLATGAGKTILEGVLLKLLNKPSMIYVPNLALVNQIKRELVDKLGFVENEIGIIDGDNKEFGKKFTICTYQSHLSLMGTKNSQYLKHLKKISVIVCDEAHRAMGEKTNEELDFSKYQEFNDVLKLGFTATPVDTKRHVESQFKFRISHTSYAELVRQEVLVPFHIQMLEGYVLGGKEIMGGIIDPDCEDQILTREKIYEKLIDQYLQLKEQSLEQKNPLHTVVFCNKINQVHRFMELANSKGLKCLSVTSEDSPKETTIQCYERVKLAEQSLLNGEADMLVTVKKLAEGWDFPELNCTIMADISTSARRIIQSAGRSSRSVENKDETYYLGIDLQVVSTMKKADAEWQSKIKKFGIKKIGLLPGMKIISRHNLVEAFRKNGESFEDIRMFCLNQRGEPLKYEFFTSVKTTQVDLKDRSPLVDLPATYFSPETIYRVFLNLSRQLGLAHYRFVTSHRFTSNIIDSLDGKHLTGEVFLKLAGNFFQISDKQKLIAHLHYLASQAQI